MTQSSSSYREEAFLKEELYLSEREPEANSVIPVDQLVVCVRWEEKGGAGILDTWGRKDSQGKTDLGQVARDETDL